MPVNVFILATGSATGATQFVRGGPCVLSAWTIGNPNTGAEYVQFFDTLATPTAGTDIPVMSLPFPAATGPAITQQCNTFFKNGLWIAATTTATGPTGAAIAMPVNLELT